MVIDWIGINIFSKKYVSIEFVDISQSQHSYKKERNDLNSLYSFEWGANLNFYIALLIKSSVVSLGDESGIITFFLHLPPPPPPPANPSGHRFQNNNQKKCPKSPKND